MIIKVLGLAVVANASLGCMTVTARVRGGPTLDSRGEPGWEVGVAAGIGWSVSSSLSVRSTPAVATSDRGGAFGTTLEVGALEEHLAWNAGLLFVLGGTEHVRSAYGAALRPLWFDRRRSEDKFSTSEVRRSLAAGLEARAGIAIDSDADSSRGLFALLPVVDWTMMMSD
ncbi:MAG TPA: hypothetical protein VIV11_01030 [Kofleriaceae bacterium]